MRASSSRALSPWTACTLAALASCVPPDRGEAPEPAGATSPAQSLRFPEGTICNASGDAHAPPERLEHVIVIVMENKDQDDVAGDRDAPYFNWLRDQCGSSWAYLDNTFPMDLDSLPHYLALTSGSNCNTGLGTSGSRCITDNDGPWDRRLNTASIFNQVGSWRAYMEDMPSPCNTGNPARGTRYWVKHNPVPYYTQVTDCGEYNIGIERVDCPHSRNERCSRPSNALVDDLEEDRLAEYSLVIPDMDNDMHDGSVTQGDNWLHTYLPIIFQSPAYLRGGTAIYVLWDEQRHFDGGSIPNLFLSPHIVPNQSSAVINHFSVLRAIEDQLGIWDHLGCASGTPPDGIGSCPNGSTADLRSIFNF